jgi:hypothetical protein
MRRSTTVGLLLGLALAWLMVRLLQTVTRVGGPWP